MIIKIFVVFSAEGTSPLKAIIGIGPPFNF